MTTNDLGMQRLRLTVFVGEGDTELQLRRTSGPVSLRNVGSLTTFTWYETVMKTNLCNCPSFVHIFDNHMNSWIRQTLQIDFRASFQSMIKHKNPGHGFDWASSESFKRLQRLQWRRQGNPNEPGSLDCSALTVKITSASWGLNGGLRSDALQSHLF